MDTYPNWSDADHSRWLNTGIKDYYKAAMMEFMRRWGMEETIDIECEVVETKQLGQWRTRILSANSNILS